MNVFATNGKGRGDSASLLVYAKEDGRRHNQTYICMCFIISAIVAKKIHVYIITVPRAPQDVATVNLNDTHVRVRWTALNPKDARGCIMGYTVHYWPASKSDLAINKPTPPNITSVVIPVVSSETYIVQVSASTGAGSGPRSRNITFDTSLPEGGIYYRCLYIL